MTFEPMGEEAASPNPENPATRDAAGRFVNGGIRPFQPGWKGGPGNPFAAKVSKIRAALLSAVTPADVKKLAQNLMTQAQGGDVAAAKVLLERLLGKPPAEILIGSAGANADSDALVLSTVAAMLARGMQPPSAAPPATNGNGREHA